MVSRKITQAHRIKYIAPNGARVSKYFTSITKAKKFYKDLMDLEYKPRIIGSYEASHSVVDIE
jgi:hypothetical protein